MMFANIPNKFLSYLTSLLESANFGSCMATFPSLKKSVHTTAVVSSSMDTALKLQTLAVL